jgi:hypothetical protein
VQTDTHNGRLIKRLLDDAKALVRMFSKPDVLPLALINQEVRRTLAMVKGAT